MVHMLPPITAFVTHPPVVDVRVVARLQPIDLILVFFHADGTASGTSRTDMRSFVDEPDTLLVEKILVSQGSDRAQINHISRHLVFQGKAR
jgi:hypothetical protein